jgi:hypothetical protein
VRPTEPSWLPGFGDFDPNSVPKAKNRAAAQRAHNASVRKMLNESEGGHGSERGRRKHTGAHVPLSIPQYCADIGVPGFPSSKEVKFAPTPHNPDLTAEDVQRYLRNFGYSHQVQAAPAE